ncbi:2,4-dihydroxyhept-2-enedioate aldolase [Izhakiella capsodis]|uniref:2,4-dihydroxyhept-2-enedioate aldolase n=1 Tax=Izhakiella capsodis TaxID=1367852 RepID=A0A1I4UE88_9GAMM|nr:aldolase/citrate lyase family protein [Izhakiella capsodis]SFM87314.1 2,4-dihydroxyhept-2-enedioate aldolase [Izhakiella capsodis]
MQNNVKNNFKEKLNSGALQIGLWLSSASPYLAEVAATSGYDWLLIDGEHAPNSVTSYLQQLQAVAPYTSHAVVRPLEGTRANIKQLLDLGAQTLLIPMVESAQQAQDVVAAFRYPPEGFRGVGASVARAARWGRIDNYMSNANDELCILIQIESQEALNNLDEILSVKGIDGLFIGPADLSASLGHPDNADHPEVQAAIKQSIERIRQAGKFAGILSVAPEAAKKYINWGATFVAVGVDLLLYTKALDTCLADYKTSDSLSKPKNQSSY